MGRLRESFDAMTPTQRGVLAVLGSVVLVVAAIAVVIAAGAGPGDELAVDTPRTTVTSSSSTTTSSTTPSSTTTSSTEPTSTSTTVTTSTSTTTTSLPPLPELRADGVGDWDFGDDAETVLGQMLAILGDPDDDTGWVDQFENYGVCLGNTVRFVRWGTMQVFFTDGPSDWAPGGVRHFASFTQAVFFDGEEHPFETAEGLALGTPVGDIRARYGPDSVYDDELYGPVFVVDPPGPAQLWGSVSGLEPDDVIETMTGSYACGE